MSVILLASRFKDMSGCGHSLTIQAFLMVNLLDNYCKVQLGFK